MRSLSEIVKSGRFHPSVQRRLEQLESGSEHGPYTPACKAEMDYHERVRAAVLRISPTTGFPAIQVPMGYTRGGLLPAGSTFFGRAWSEPTLIRLAYAYEQATRHRRPPPTTPPLR